MSTQEIRLHSPFANLLQDLVSASRRVVSGRRMAPLDELDANPPSNPTWYAVRNGLDYLSATCGAVPAIAWRV